MGWYWIIGRKRIGLARVIADEEAAGAMEGIKEVDVAGLWDGHSSGIVSRLQYVTWL